jgi:hypothetical protein
MDGLVVAARLLLGLVGPEIRLLLRSELAHELMVAVSLLHRFDLEICPESSRFPAPSNEAPPEGLGAGD